ncbi:F-box protein At5g03970-like [Abrus precatorius]|uniref:F-box protein At5g03970-like n=1 Tax=Abrus precatorius TaxID=3816 RepID=A0A8B8K3N4_ABRPR|nr:F-box protein At5g03970-like [Abrus precatorius]
MVATMSPSTNYPSKSNTTINNLFNDSLTEIFCRLSCKSLLTCKSVSQHWLALISDPNFHSLYLTHQSTLFQDMQAQGEDPDQPSFILKPYNALVIAPKLPSLQLGHIEKQLSLSFLGSDFEPTNVVPQLRSILKFVFGCSNGLLLCGNPRPCHKCIYHICNPLTRDMLELPSALSLCDHAGVLVGFTCDPYYCLEKEVVSVVSSSQRKFRVVRIPAFSDMRFSFNVEVFYSETGKWNRFVVSCPKGFACGFFLMASSVEHDGKLYFMGGGRVLVYDPYNDEQVASIIELPSGFGEPYRGCLGVSCGRLQLSEFPILPPIATAYVGAYSGRVWELQFCDYGKGGETTWKMVHEFDLPDIVGPIFEELKVVEGEHVRGCSRILAFHPYARDTVFFMLGDHILYCNLLTGRFKVTKYSGLSLVFYPVIPFVLPWWPTPIPPLPS